MMECHLSDSPKAWGQGELGAPNTVVGLAFSDRNSGKTSTANLRERRALIQTHYL